MQKKSSTFCVQSIDIGPGKIQKTSKSTTRKHMLSKSTTHQALTSKSLCQGKNHAFGLVSSKRYSAVFGTPDFVLKHRKYQYYWAFRTLTSPPLSSIPRTPREILRLFHTFIKHQYSNEFMCFSINTVLSSLCF